MRLREKKIYDFRCADDVQLAIESTLQIICDQDWSSLTACITVEEIEGVVNDMTKEKLPGPAGYPIEFYKNTWEIRKESVFEAVKTYFFTGIMPKYFNGTSQCIIPKVNNPQNMKQFTPMTNFLLQYNIQDHFYYNCW
ncbi:hypothetical protein LIER_26035 [Lithospermum erythrorhizon]|uniref:Reverse transcriptase n=1 Tax=Lithospermum erythrorhizon TaxID=34254 RepID=A0AAV3R8H6_LITER